MPLVAAWMMETEGKGEREEGSRRRNRVGSEAEREEKLQNIVGGMVG